MKKALVLMIAVLLCTTAVFAASGAVKVSAVPYGFQISTSTADGQDPVNSRYGIGLEAAYQLKITENFYAEAGLGWDTFLMPDEKPAFTNLLAFAGLGCSYDLSEKITCSASIDAGTDTLFYNDKVSETFTLKAGLDASYALNDSLKLSLGCEGTFGFAKKDSVHYVNYRILPVLGVSYEF